MFYNNIMKKINLKNTILMTLLASMNMSRASLWDSLKNKSASAYDKTKEGCVVAGKFTLSELGFMGDWYVDSIDCNVEGRLGCMTGIGIYKTLWQYQNPFFSVELAPGGRVNWAGWSSNPKMTRTYFSQTGSCLDRFKKSFSGIFYISNIFINLLDGDNPLFLQLRFGAALNGLSKQGMPVISVAVVQQRNENLRLGLSVNNVCYKAGYHDPIGKLLNTFEKSGTH